MSYYGDGSPHQELREYVELVRDQYKLTDADICIILAQVLNSLLDPHEAESEKLRAKEKQL